MQKEQTIENGDWRLIVDVETINAAGETLTINDTPEICSAISTRLAVPSVSDLHAKLSLQPISSSGLRVTGALSAKLQRICVASLELMEEHIDETLDYTFDAGEPQRAGPATIEEEGTLDDLSVDTLEDGTLDVADLLCQHLAIAMSAFPRREDAEDLVASYGHGGDISAFSGLKDVLKKP